MSPFDVELQIYMDVTITEAKPGGTPRADASAWHLGFALAEGGSEARPHPSWPIAVKASFLAGALAGEVRRHAGGSFDLGDLIADAPGEG